MISCLLAGLGSASAQNQPYPTEHRMQLSESCPLVAKWLSQGTVSGAHWQLEGYDQGLGILTFKVIDMSLTKADIRQLIDNPKAKNVHIDEVVFTLRSLVSSSLSFDGGRPSPGDSCTIAMAIKFVGKDGQRFYSNGIGEAQMLQVFDARYKAHGLDY
jgi:hypothetical protein